jgi:hypothetical protein
LAERDGQQRQDLGQRGHCALADRGDFLTPHRSAVTPFSRLSFSGAVCLHYKGSKSFSLSPLVTPGAWSR